MSSHESFMGKCLRGEALVEEVDDFIECWHNDDVTSKTLPAYLGMTDVEYECFVSSARNLIYIVSARRKGISLMEFLENIKKDEIRIAARLNKNSQEINSLLERLKKKYEQ